MKCGGVIHLLLSMLTPNFKLVPETLASEIVGSIIFFVHANSLTLKLHLRILPVRYLGVNHFLLSMLTLNFKIVPDNLFSETGGVSHLLLSMLTLNFKIVPETLASEMLWC